VSRCTILRGMDLRTATRFVAGQWLLTIDGTADLASVPLVHDALRRFVTDHADSNASVDLDGAVVLDDATIGLLIGAAATMRDAGGSMRLVCSKPRLRERLDRLRVDRIIDVVNSFSTTEQADIAYDCTMDDERTP
jgi:anti-anti-sigma factor